VRTVYIKFPGKPDRYYRAQVSQQWAVRHDNFALVSVGLTVGEDLSLQSFKRLGPTAVEVTHTEWNHSGCQSACQLRGAKECRW